MNAVALLNDKLVRPERSPATLVEVFLALVALNLLLDVVGIFVKDAWVPVELHHH